MRVLKLTLATGLACIVLAACGGADGAGSAQTPPTSVAGTPSASTVNQRPEPARMQIDSIGIASTIDPVGTDDRVLQIPPDPSVVGWWRDGVRPGDGRGTVVMTAHLDSRKYGTGPFVRAKELKPGAAMTLTDAQGGQKQYRVARVEAFKKKALPYASLFRQEGPERAVLVTCGGTYDAANGGWDSNVVVTFSPVA